LKIEEKIKVAIKYYHKYFKPFSNYKQETLNDGKASVFALSSIAILRHIKIQSEANPFDKQYGLYFLKRWSKLNTRTLTLS